MSKVIFIKNPETIYTCDFTQIGENQIRLIFESDLPSQDIYLSGCYLVNEWNPLLIQTNRDDYIYVYRKYDDAPNIIELCNNNVPYIENKTDIPDLEQYTPTLTQVKSTKISELSLICNKMIIHGIDIEIDGIQEHFSYTDEDQRNIKELFDIVLQTNNSMYYHSDNEGCKLYSVEQIISLYIAEVTNKMHNTIYFNQLKMYIESLDDANDISSIVYGSELSGKYLDTYNNAMLKAKENIELLLQNRQQIISSIEG